MATAGYLNKFNNKKQNDTKSIVSQQSSKKSNTTECKTKEDLLIKMQQNEEKHRQLMIENNKRRKEQEKKLKQQEEEKNKQAAALLEQRKKTKEQAYLNYLRNNTKQILADYQPRQTDYPKPNPKPIVEKKVQTNYNNFEALDLEVSQVAKNKKLPQEFQKQWEDFEVMRKSELLDSLDLSTAQKTKQPSKKNELQTILGLPEENSDDEEELWKNTMKGGQLAKQQSSKPPLSKPMQWAEQAITQADDVLSKMSQKQDREKRETLIKQEVSKQKQNSTSVPKKNTQTNEHMKILQQKEQQLLAQQMQIQQQNTIEPQIQQQYLQQQQQQQQQQSQQQQQRKPQQNIRITNKQVYKHSSSVQDEQNHIQEFLKEDLQNVNDLEMQLQMELKNLNKENKQKIENIQEKYGVRNLHSSNQVNRIVFVENQQPIKSIEDQIEASLLKLDLMLQQPPQKPIEQVQIQPPSQQQQFQQQQYQQQQTFQSQQQQQIPQQMNQQQYQQLLEQQIQLQKQLLLAQQQIQLMQQQQQPSPMLQQQNQLQQQLNQIQQLQQQQQQYQQQQQQQQQQYQQQQQQQQQTTGSEFPRFPSYVLHQDHHSFVQTFTSNPTQKTDQKGINQKPRNVITNDNQSISVVSSQQNDKYSFDLDFGVKGGTYTQQAMKKQTQKQSQVKQQTPIEEEEEQEDGKIEVREDLRNLLFD